MAAVYSLDKLKRALDRSPPGPAYLVTGAEAVLRDEAVQAILDAALDPGLRDFNLDIVDAGEADPDQLAGLCTTLPMMAERRVVVVRDIGQWRRRTRGRTAMAAILERPAPETVVVLTETDADEPKKHDKTLAALCQVVQCDSLDTEGAIAWVRARAEATGVRLEPAAAAHLVTVAGSDLGLLRAEVEKLEAFAGSDPVTAERVGDLVGVRFGETIDDWADHVLAGRTAEALRLLPLVLGQTNSSGVRLVTLLGAQLLLVGVLRAAHDRRVPARGLSKLAWDILTAERPAGLGSWGAVVDRSVAAVRRWPMPRLDAALAALLAADRALKSTGLADEEAVVTDLLLRLAASQPVRA